MKKTSTIKKVISLFLISCFCFGLASCSNNNSGTMSEEISFEDSYETSQMDNSKDTSTESSQSNSSNSHGHDENVDFILDVEIEPSETEKGIINAIISISHIHSELMAVQFNLTFTSNTVQGVYKDNDEMAKTMTVIPTYKTTSGLVLPRFEQICVYNKASSIYECMYVDLLRYPQAEQGQSFKGISSVDEFVITIPFKVNDDASAGSVVSFDFIQGSVSGTTQDFMGAKGYGNGASYTLTEKDLSK